MIKDKLLPVEQVVYVPSTNKSQRPISPSRMQRRVAEVKRFLSKKYEGFTAVKGEGGYATQDKKEKIIQEGITEVTSFTTRDKFNRNKIALISQLRKWGNRWGQESMGLEVEGDLRYIYSNPMKPKVPITVKQMQERHSPSWIDTETKVWR